MDIRKYEKMVKLDLPDCEREQITHMTEKLLNSFSVLDSIDISGVRPYVPDRQSECLREDISTKTITREKLLSNAPEQYDGYFQIPRTV